MTKKTVCLYLFFSAALLLNLAFWNYSRKVFSEWDNVPPAPSENTAAFSGMGDREISYRLVGYILQNLGNVGGMYQPLQDYDYDRLGRWFTVSETLNDRSNYVPYIAAFYFGAMNQKPEKLTPLIDYLADIGVKPGEDKWRWLAQAVYLARFVQKDMDKALKLANILAELPDVAPWARQMPAFVQLAMGNKEASYEIMLNMLKSEGGKLPVAEVNAMKAYICERTLEPAEAAKNPLCQNYK
ncbi:MAG: hypothetical protein DI551_09645 [Micavibrio aeruginosavorus]|uniref:Tetratricopeptide repeat-like domain-containing protein n=1 Tax=Micavibrio aeruginosavorus TaxID=349221 RepID=A0A2W5PJB2_9BACT|nr:MAG: hypothetical protein DI551_09645 [Micavibrio aeruginosavorus]